MTSDPRICDTCNHCELALSVEPCFSCITQYTVNGVSPGWKQRQDDKTGAGQQ
jgi:hypothetical protein